MARNKIQVELELLNAQYLQSLKKSENRTKQFNSTVKTSSKSAAKSIGGISTAFKALAAGTVIFAIIGAMKKLVEITDVQQKAEAQLNQVLKTTQNAAGLTADEIKNMASSLQTVTTFGDEAIIGGQNLLLTFTKIGKDVFPQATEMMLDMSQALGQDMKSSAIQLGKALNDPIQGVTALRRVGVQLSDQQTAQIKHFMAINDIASAQKIILAELGTQVGGSARAATKTVGGMFKQLSNSFGDLLENVGNKVTPAFKDLTESLSFAVEGGGILSQTFSLLGTLLTKLVQGITVLANSVNVVFSSIQVIYNKLYAKVEKMELARLERLKAAGTQIIADAKGTYSIELAIQKKKDEIAAATKKEQISTGKLQDATRMLANSWNNVTGNIQEATSKNTANAKNLIRRQNAAAANTKKNNADKKKSDAEYYAYIGQKREADLVKAREQYAKTLREHGSTAEKKKAIDEAYQTQVSNIEKKYQQKRLAQTRAWIQSGVDAISSTLGQLSEVYNMSFQARMDQVQFELDARLESINTEREAALEAAGLRQETNSERLNTELQTLRQTLNAETNAEQQAALRSQIIQKEDELERQKINDKYDALELAAQEAADKKKRKLERENAKRMKKINIIETIITTASAAMNAYKSLAGIPYAGPALGAAAAAAVTALGATKIKLIQDQPLPPLATGTYSVPADMPAQLHAKEMVIPKKFSESIRSGEATLGTPQQGNIVLNIAGSVIGIDDILEVIDRERNKKANGMSASNYNFRGAY